MFWYKASEHPPFRLCDPTLWVDNRQFESSMLRDGEYDASSLKKKNAQPTVWVKKL